MHQMGPRVDCVDRASDRPLRPNDGHDGLVRELRARAARASHCLHRVPRRRQLLHLLTLADGLTRVEVMCDLMPEASLQAAQPVQRVFRAEPGGWTAEVYRAPTAQYDIDSFVTSTSSQARSTRGTQQVLADHARVQVETGDPGGQATCGARASRSCLMARAIEGEAAGAPRAYLAATGSRRSRARWPAQG